MYRKALFTALLGTALLTNGVEAGIGSPHAPMIETTQVDGRQALLIIRGQHFGSATPTVVMGQWQLKVREHSEQRIVAELPRNLNGSSYRIQVISSSRERASSEPFFATLLVADNP